MKSIETKSRYHDDSFYQPLIESFVEDLPKTLDQLASHADAKDIEAFQNICHRLAGSAATYGYAQVAKYFDSLEMNIKQGHLPSEKLKGTVEEIDQLFGQMAQEIQIGDKK
jgi:HPt (histidine-containing phosphotransfer) domain-containing protein